MRSLLIILSYMAIPSFILCIPFTAMFKLVPALSGLSYFNGISAMCLQACITLWCGLQPNAYHTLAVAQLGSIYHIRANLLPCACSALPMCTLVALCFLKGDFVILQPGAWQDLRADGVPPVRAAVLVLPFCIFP